jgi:hypothetical protein
MEQQNNIIVIDNNVLKKEFNKVFKTNNNDYKRDDLLNEALNIEKLLKSLLKN